MKNLFKIVAIGLIFTSVAYAQQQPEFNLKVDGKEIELIGKALGMLPYSEVAPLMGKLQSQIQAQMKPIPPIQTKPEGK